MSNAEDAEPSDLIELISQLQTSIERDEAARTAMKENFIELSNAKLSCLFTEPPLTSVDYKAGRMTARLQKLVSDTEILKYQTSNRRMVEARLLQDIPQLKRQILHWKQRTKRCAERMEAVKERHATHKEGLDEAAQAATKEIQNRPEWTQYSQLRDAKATLQAEVDALTEQTQSTAALIEEEGRQTHELVAAARGTDQMLAQLGRDVAQYRREAGQLEAALAQMPEIDLPGMEARLRELEERARRAAEDREGRG